ncbi:MAG: hypothetical protein M5U34_23575 [Chloroflexi bacterium]|nr:hypothetical protein [Chloroflexota bacterium]
MNKGAKWQSSIVILEGVTDVTGRAQELVADFGGKAVMGHERPFPAPI